MAISIDWGNRIINVPRNDMLLVQSTPTEIRQLDLSAFRLELKDLEDDIEGMPFPDTHKHNTTTTVGGVTLARVIEIINGYTITFEDGQYAVNLVGANSNVADVTNVNQVSVRSANSAGLTYSKEIEDQSFLDGRIWINTTEGFPGTQYPLGTSFKPVDNLVDANGIAANRGFRKRFHLHGNLVLSDTEDLSNSNWLGAADNLASLQLDGNDVSKSIFREITIIGPMNPTGECTIAQGNLDGTIPITNFLGDVVSCGLNGTIGLPAGVSSTVYTFDKCFSDVPGTGTPILDCNNASNLNIQFRAYAGGIEIRNFTSANNNMSIDLISGHIKIDSSCTNGTIVIRGTGHVTNNSTGVTLTTKGLGTTEDSGLLTTKKFIALK